MRGDQTLNPEPLTLNPEPLEKIVFVFVIEKKKATKCQLSSSLFSHILKRTLSLSTPFALVSYYHYYVINSRERGEGEREIY